MGFSHYRVQMVSTAHCSLKDVFLKTALSVGTVGKKVPIKDRGGVRSFQIPRSASSHILLIKSFKSISSPNLQVTPPKFGVGIRRQGFGEVLRSVRWNLQEWDYCPYKKDPRDLACLLLPHEDTVRSHPSPTGRGFLSEPNHAGALIWTSSHQDCEQQISTVYKPSGLWHFVRAA